MVYPLCFLAGTSASGLHLQYYQIHQGAHGVCLSYISGAVYVLFGPDMIPTWQAVSSSCYNQLSSPDTNVNGHHGLCLF